MNEVSSILMSSAGKKIITKVITSHWLRINIGKTNFAELMIVNYMKVKLTEGRIGRIVVRVLNSFFRERAVITLFIQCVNLLITIKWKTCSFLSFSRLITRREIEFWALMQSIIGIRRQAFIHLETSKHCNYITRNWMWQVVVAPPLA